jgi:hypothetical protein
MSLVQSVVSLPTSPFPPLAVGFMGLGTGYLIYGPQELFGYPKRDERVDFATGMWGIWMPGFMQFITGVYLFVGLTWLHSFTAPALYAAALAFTAYGVHWFSIGWNRLRRADPRANQGMTVGFALISILGIIAFFGVHDAPVGGLFIGLTCIYVSDFFACLGPEGKRLTFLGEKALGFFHLGTGFWLMYLMFADVLNAVLNYKLPL